MLEIDFAQLSDPGMVRDHNEDYLGQFTPTSPAQERSHGWLFAVADGVGGQDFGEVASRLAVEGMIAGFRSASAGEAHVPLLQRLVQSANVKVYETGLAASPGGSPMATTIVACALRYDRVVVAHVGDSRCYLLRHGNATALTRDHSVVAEQVRMGLMTAREAGEAETRHLLTRCLGNTLFAGVDTSDHQVIPGDTLLLCSDGLHGSVGLRDLEDIVLPGGDLEAAAAKLVALAKDRDGSDNITVQLVRVRGVERMGMYRGRPYKLR
jgi:serine/threonine protein phosphatase PrpC